MDGDVQNQNVNRATNCPFRGCVKREVGLVKPHPDVGCPAPFLACGCVGAVSDGFARYVRLKMLKNSARTCNDTLSPIRNVRPALNCSVGRR